MIMAIPLRHFHDQVILYMHAMNRTP